METIDRQRFGVALTGLGEVYDKRISPSLALTYFRDLSEYSIDAVLAAIEAHRKSSKFFPRISELIERLQPNTEQVAMVRWADVMRQLPNSHIARSDDPVTERVVADLGGWNALGTTDTAKLVWVEKEFCRRYEMYAEHGVDLPQRIERSGLTRIGRVVR